MNAISRVKCLKEVRLSVDRFFFFFPLFVKHFGD